MKLRVFCAFIMLSAVFLSCRREEISAVVREDLFSLEIGMREDQAALFSLEGGIAATSVAMRDGLFYVAWNSGAKIVRYSSYGDAIFMIYNDEVNPPPLAMRTNVERGEVVTRWAVSWPLASPGRIAVDTRKHIFVEDRLPPERRVIDRENRVLLDSMILHFDEAGRFVEYLGQEGIGGTPFPRINNVYTSINDELAVVCRLPSGWAVYWFDAAGAPRFTVLVHGAAVPLPPGRPDVFPSVDTIAAAPDRRQLFLKVDYYRAVNDESTGTRAGVEPDSSIVWVLDAETGAYVDSIEVPFYEEHIPGRGETQKLFYSLMGVIREGRVFLSHPVDGGYLILILQMALPGGEEAGRRQGFIRVGNDELEFNAFALSGDGLLSGLLATEQEVRMAFWRTDRLAEEMLP
jgi:hypothetical protein